MDTKREVRMANQAAQLFVAYMESKDMKVQFLDEEERLIRLGFDLENTEISIFVQFGEDESDVHFEGRDFVKVPKGKEELIYRVCNKCNDNYRWAKFVWDEENNALCCRCDAVIQLDTCAEEIFEIIARMASIVDNAYPLFMKTLWA